MSLFVFVLIWGDGVLSKLDDIQISFCSFSAQSFFEMLNCQKVHLLLDEETFADRNYIADFANFAQIRKILYSAIRQS